MQRFSLRSSESGGDGTCRGFWELTTNTSSPQWEAMALTSAPKSPWWPKAAQLRDGPPPAKMISPRSERHSIKDESQRSMCLCSTHTGRLPPTSQSSTRLQLHSFRNSLRAGRRVPQCSWSRFGVWCMNSLVVMMYLYCHDVYQKRSQMEDGEIQLQVQIRLTFDYWFKQHKVSSKSTVSIQRAWSGSSVLPKLHTVAEENCGKNNAWGERCMFDLWCLSINSLHTAMCIYSLH